MGTNIIAGIRCTLILAGALLAGGCATLTVTPQQPVTSTMARQPVSLGIQVAGERLTHALTDPKESAATAATGTLFEKVVLLPKETRSKSSAEIQAAFGTDYILSGTIADVNVSGNLNPIWFASIPLLFFKPYAPIVTFEAIVTLESTLRDARSGVVLMQKETSSVVTDYFSPMDPQEKVRTLISRGINNAFVSILEESQQKIAAAK
ncbi:hypothetical protein [Geomobilimonas luticola]|uniref:Lipoprotein n=1 Tax=Geomobilimonas luticola TaxID=1114878 RepID=A0ABS5SFP5_9BACT|nr:hypothetical protein [Geomobilimonas luticola]MBT0654190.1 hypothetical protein [Geomobilimonas luticola]